MKHHVALPYVLRHPNRFPFNGRLASLGKPSDKAPFGARQHRVILTAAAAEEALPSLIGMGVNYRVGWNGHDARNKVGVITTAEIRDESIFVGGFVYGRDFPEVVSKTGDLGMSYELVDAQVADMSEAIWTLTRVIFVGASILERTKAAYRDTSFEMEQA